MTLYRQWIPLLAIVMGALTQGPVAALALPITASSNQSKVNLNKSVQYPHLQIEAGLNSTKKFDGTWESSLLGRQAQDEFNQRTLSEFTVKASLNYRPIEFSTLNFSPRFKYITGYAQTQSQSKNSQSDWTVANASFEVNTQDYFDAAAGALNQEKNHHSLLLSDDVTFPALAFKIHTARNQNLTLGIRAETAVATSSSLSTQTKDFEKTPTFNSVGLYLSNLNKSDFSQTIEGQVAVSRWQFDYLPSAVATESGLIGNTVRNLSDGTDSEFIYKYQGLLANADLKANLSPKISIGVAAAYIKNEQSPATLNQGSWSKAYAELWLNRNWMISPAYEFFRVESDAVVTSYNSRSFGSNSIGYLGTLAVEYKKTIRVGISGGEKDAIIESPFQSREKTWTLKLETLNVSI